MRISSYQQDGFLYTLVARAAYSLIIFCESEPYLLTFFSPVAAFLRNTGIYILLIYIDITKTVLAVYFLKYSDKEQIVPFGYV